MDRFMIPTIVKLFIIIIYSAYAAKYCIKLVIELLNRAGCTRENYKKNRVPFAAGIVFLPVILSASLLSIYFFPDSYPLYIGYLFAVNTIGFAGLLDDMIGEKNIKGLGNHTLSFFKGHITTGFMKAVIGFMTALIASVSISKGVIDYIINALIFALFTNTLNLMDLRPGRCAKTFLAIGFIIFALKAGDIAAVLPLAITLCIGFVYLVYDLKELCMLGDTGSNVLGATLGYFSAVSFNMPVKLLVFAVLLLINAAAEKVSLTSIISKNKVLNYLDNIGRSSG